MPRGSRWLNDRGFAVSAYVRELVELASRPALASRDNCPACDGTGFEVDGYGHVKRGIHGDPLPCPESLIDDPTCLGGRYYPEGDE